MKKPLSLRLFIFGSVLLQCFPTQRERLRPRQLSSYPASEEATKVHAYDITTPVIQMNKRHHK